MSFQVSPRGPQESAALRRKEPFVAIACIEVRTNLRDIDAKHTRRMSSIDQDSGVVFLGECCELLHWLDQRGLHTTSSCESDPQTD